MCIRDSNPHRADLDDLIEIPMRFFGIGSVPFQIQYNLRHESSHIPQCTAAEQMKMQMRHGLPRIGAVVRHHPEARDAERLRNLRHHFKYMRHQGAVFRRHRTRSGYVLFRDDQHMHRRFGFDVVKLSLIHI